MTDLLHFDSVVSYFFSLFFLSIGAGHRLLPWCPQRSKWAWYSSNRPWQGLGDCGRVVCEGNWWSQWCAGRAHHHTDDGTSDFMSTAAAVLTTLLHLKSIKIARREIKVSSWKSQTLLLLKTSNPLSEWRRGVQIFPWLSLLARRVLAIPDTSASPERLFPTSGNTMTRKRCSLSCDNLEECVYLHET